MEETKKIKRLDYRNRHPNLVYDQSFCDRVIDHVKQGYTFNSFAAVIGVSVTTLSRWVEKYEKFAEAKEIAQQYLSMRYQDYLDKAASGESKGNASAITFGLTNIDPENFKNKINHEVRDERPIIIDTGFVRQVLSDDGAVEVDFEEIRELSVDDL